MKKVLIVYNPVAGQRDVREELEEVMAFMRAHDWEVALRQTMGAGDATTFAREAVANRFDMVVAAGGDGTLGEVVTGLACSDCALGVLPIGTGNVWAHMIGLPVWTPINRTALMDSAHVLVEGKTHCIDLGRAADRFFILWCGIGFDAQIIREVEPHREIRRNLGNITYIVASIVLSFGLRGNRVTVAIDGKAVRQRALLILTTNGQLYANTLRVAPNAQLDDGLLDIYIFKGGNTLDAFRHFGMMMLGKHLRDPKVESYRGRRIEIRADRPLPLNVDGESAGYTPVNIAVVPKALRVVMPAWASGSLFEDGSPESASAPSMAQRIVERLHLERERWREEGERIRSDWERWLGLPKEE